MKAVLVRIGVDQAYGRWNAPVDANGHFVYVPIPEKYGTQFHPGLERRYDEILPSLSSFCAKHDCDLTNDLRFPPELLSHSMHLDPDFEHLTYGDKGLVRGAEMRNMTCGDLVIFYAGLKPIHRCEHKLVYALIGMYVVNSVADVASIPSEKWRENAHVRKIKRGESDIIIFAKPELSGRFNRCVPIGEWRKGAYRVRQNVLDAWGGLSVKDGFIQRSAVPPLLQNPRKFLSWFELQNVQLTRRNN